MNQSFKKFLTIAALFSVTAVQADSCSTSCDTSGDCATTSCYPNRSQSRYKVHQVSGMRGHTHDIQNDMDSWWGTMSITPAYHQTFKSKEIAQCLFNGDLVNGCDCDGRAIKVQGRDVANRDAKAWLADYFYLPSDFDSTLTFEPKIKNFMVGLDFFLGLDEWWKGAYVRLHAPITHSRWDLNLCETVNADGTTDHAQGYFTTDTLSRTSLLSNFKSYAAGNAPAQDGDVVFGALRCAKMACDTRKETGLADLRMELGWNFWTDEDYHLGLNLQAAAPTGNSCCPNYLFDAVVGNGNHWELGGGLTGHYVFWRSEDAEKHFGFYADASITHMFDHSGKRTFDLNDKPNSKYMLAAKFGTNDEIIVGTSNAGTAATKIFANEYTPVANLTTVAVDVSSSVQADVVTWFNFTSGGFSWDLGYNLYARSCEDIDCDTDCSKCPSDKPSLADASQANTWVLKGDARMFGYDGATAERLSASQSKATIHAGTEAAVGVPLTGDAHANANADKPEEAFLQGGNDLDVSSGSATRINTSIQPVFLGKTDINFAGTRSISHAVFTHLSYNFEGDKWRPYLGVGAMAEFGSTDDCCDSSDSCDSCMDCAPSYWGVWVKGGVSFD